MRDRVEVKQNYATPFSVNKLQSQREQILLENSWNKYSSLIYGLIALFFGPLIALEYA